MNPMSQKYPGGFFISYFGYCPKLLMTTQPHYWQFIKTTIFMNTVLKLHLIKNAKNLEQEFNWLESRIHSPEKMATPFSASRQQGRASLI